MDATLVFTGRFDVSAMEWLRKRGLPLVLVDQEPIPGVAAVNVDDHEAGWPRNTCWHSVIGVSGL
jgi:DNA-binding LacI/PurR family transcriptional regulator